MKIGILGGSFDPIHQGHLKLGLAALRQLKLNQVYFLLSPRSPYKTQQKITPVAHRIKMSELALKGKRRFSLAKWEIKRKGPSYTVTTLRAYKKKHPSHDIFLILGSDAYRGFTGWKDFQKIRKWATLVVGHRSGSTISSKKVSVRKGDILLKGQFPTISSTEVRRGFQQQKRIVKLLPQGVVSYIKKKQLYATHHD